MHIELEVNMSLLHASPISDCFSLGSHFCSDAKSVVP